MVGGSAVTHFFGPPGVASVPSRTCKLSTATRQTRPRPAAQETASTTYGVPEAPPRGGISVFGVGDEELRVSPAAGERAAPCPAALTAGSAIQIRRGSLSSLATSPAVAGVERS